MILRKQLSAFAMQTMPEVWPDAVQGIINTFQQQNLPHLEVSERTSNVALFGQRDNNNYNERA